MSKCEFRSFYLVQGAEKISVNWPEPYDPEKWNQSCDMGTEMLFPARITAGE